MTPALRASARHWLAGIVLAAAGVAVFRVLAPVCGVETRALVAALGRLLGLAGLGVIALGIRRRIRLAETTAAASPDNSAAPAPVLPPS